MDKLISKSPVTPFSLKDAPSLIECVWPAQKISVEAQRERDAKQGQILTSLGSYWKGRKPLVLARACVLGALLPATFNQKKDLEVFEILLGIADAQILSRLRGPIPRSVIEGYGTPDELAELLGGRDNDGRPQPPIVSRDRRLEMMAVILGRVPYQERVAYLYRIEEVAEEDLIAPFLSVVNDHLGVDIETVGELVEALGVMRFGRRPLVADTFCGGGSIPFEAARIGCDVYASDLNPVACMLTWGAINVIGASKQRQSVITKDQERVHQMVLNRPGFAGGRFV